MIAIQEVQEGQEGEECEEGQEDFGNRESALEHREPTLKHPRAEMEGEETECDSSDDEPLACKRLRFHPKDENIEYFSEPSDDDDEGDTSDEHREVPLDDHPNPLRDFCLRTSMTKSRSRTTTRKEPARDLPMTTMATARLVAREKAAPR